MSDLESLETIASELIEVFGITAPPVPIESMLQHPVNNMWATVDITQLSGSFLSFKDYYSPRMSLARMLVRHVAVSDWGKQRNLSEILTQNDDFIRAFARMIIMPKEMVLGMTSAGRNPTTMSLQFEVPEEDARLRLQELT